MLDLLYLSSVSACFELKNDTPYYAPEPFDVLINGHKERECATNVFSLKNLLPDTEYELCVCGGAENETVAFRTRKETCALSVRDFGAVGDGTHEDTAAIQTAISCLPPGGRLFFPPGRYLTLPLMLKSHITLHFADGATLLGSPERERYPVIPGTARDLDGGAEQHFGGFEGCAREMYQSLLTAEYASDIEIIGPGTVDGNAQNSDFWTAFHEFSTARPRLMFFNRCKNVTVHGVHACNAPSWQLHPYYSEDVSFYDVLVTAPKDSPNTDALDPESCDRVNIVGCRFTVGDDCIAIKSGKIELGSTLNRAASRHVVRNCLMEYGHGAVVLGSEIGAGVRSLSVSQCLFRGTDRGLRIKTRRGRGKNCVIDNVSFENIRMDGVLTPIAVNMWYNCCDPDRESEYVWSREKLPVDERTPHLGSFRFRNIACTNAQVAACYIDGLPEAPVDSVTFENFSVTFSPDAKPGVPIMENFAKKRCRMGLYLDNVRHIRIDGVTLEGVEGEKLLASHCESIETARFDEE